MMLCNVLYATKRPTLCSRRLADILHIDWSVNYSFMTKGAYIRSPKLCLFVFLRLLCFWRRP